MTILELELDLKLCQGSIFFQGENCNKKILKEVLQAISILYKYIYYYYYYTINEVNSETAGISGVLRPNFYPSWWLSGLSGQTRTQVS